MTFYPLRATLVGLLAVFVVGACSAQTVRVTSVIDGDTIVVQTATGKESVRLIGIDTPESHHPRRPPEYFAEEATEFVRSRVEGRRVRLEPDEETEDRDSYGRLLRYVYLPDDRMLNEMLIRQGYAYAYTRFPFTKAERFTEIEARARAESIGVWSEGGLAELRWILEQGGAKFAVYPMTNRSWAIEYGEQVKTRVPSNQLVRQLNQLLALLAEHQGAALRRELEARGYVTLVPEGVWRQDEKPPDSLG